MYNPPHPPPSAQEELRGHVLYQTQRVEETLKLGEVAKQPPQQGIRKRDKKLHYQFLEEKIKLQENYVNEFAPSSLTTLLKTCAKLKDLSKGRKIHDEAIKKGFLDKSAYIGSSLVNMYAKCGALSEARNVFDEFPSRDVAFWNAIIAGYALHGHGEEALKCYEEMLLDGFLPNPITFVCILKACGSIGAIEKGREIHAEIAKQGLIHRNVLVANALLDMYSKCGALVNAQEVFDELSSRDVMLWTALIGGYAQHGHGEKALNCFVHMEHEGICPNASTFVCILKACGSIGASDRGTEIHKRIVKEGLLKNNILVGNAVVDMYAKCGLVAKAKEVFDELPIRDVFLWTTLITGYVQHNYDEEALKCFGSMRCEGLSPDAATFVCILKACGSIGAISKGKELHAEIIKKKLLKKNVIIGTALVDMYAKCGELIKAQELFDTLSIRNVVSWTAIIAGYALLGKENIVFGHYMKMIEEGIIPNLLTLSSVLNVCSHSGMLGEAQMCFNAMCNNSGIDPTLEHYNCMIDLYCRAGRLDKAVAMMENMPFSADQKVLHTLLSACQRWQNVKLGRIVFEHAIQLDEKDAIAYVCMSNIYAAAELKMEEIVR